MMITGRTAEVVCDRNNVFPVEDIFGRKSFLAGGDRGGTPSSSTIFIYNEIYIILYRDWI